MRRDAKKIASCGESCTTGTDLLRAVSEAAAVSPRAGQRRLTRTRIAVVTSSPSGATSARRKVLVVAGTVLALPLVKLLPDRAVGTVHIQTQATVLVLERVRTV